MNDVLDRIGFTEPYVEGCILSVSSTGAKHKALKDAVWGMMEFDISAMRLIDSPILQRLRRIKQLGFSYLTYPSAEHSRFPHSVGMAHVITKFLDAIDRRAGDIEMQADYLDGYKQLQDLKPLKADELVHAALLHDIGHLPFSHAAETAIASAPSHFVFGGLEFEEFVDRINDALKAKVSLSEAISIAVILSPRFERFYSKYVCHGSNHDNMALARIVCMIAGRRMHDKCGNIQGLISSSSVDADKIDYVNRDAAACGIPVGVDVSRVFLGSALLGIKPEKAKELRFGGNDTFIFALNASGWDTYDEIIRARSMLYQRVYLHSFTRTAEAIFARALRLNAGAVNDALHIWALTDDAVLDSLVGSPISEVASLASSLRDRQMPKKACALGTALVATIAPIADIFPDVFRGPDRITSYRSFVDQIAEPFRQKFTRDLSGQIDSVTFENSVIKEAVRIRDVLSNAGNKQVPTGQLSHVALITIAGLDHKNSDAPVFQHGEVLSSGQLTNVRGVSDASDHFRQIGYVMAPSNWREIVSVATRAVLYRLSLEFDSTKFSIDDKPELEKLEFLVRRLTVLDMDGVHRRTGLDRFALGVIMEDLARASYFDEFPSLALKTDLDEVEDAFPKIEKFAGEKGWSVDRKTIRAFVDQFPPGLRSDLIAAMKRGNFVDRNHVVELLAPKLKSLSETGEKLLVVPLSLSSGAPLISPLRQHLKTSDNIEFANSLQDALKVLGERTIVFVDDNSVSGTQAAAQLHAFHSSNRKLWPEKMQSEAGLHTELKDEDFSVFATTNFRIVVAFGHSNAAKTLHQTADILDLQGFKGVSYVSEITETPSWSNKLRAYLTKVGEQLIAHDRWEKNFDKLDSRDQETCREHAFGFGGIGGLTVFQNSVPTSTVTAFWMPGMVDGRPWIPLAIRHGRVSKLLLG
ncbi:HD domain-containing protein [Agrobacterium sp. DSM 25558]|uniref:phosphoribosyltransferase-like protein n=1 Tax=Agrobacterium sp. DSM 25558 TaxID=1907665 RepID=UPI0013566979|nr:HD domain-containing protein [Agrobacterium sp. DSM 25558]